MRLESRIAALEQRAGLSGCPCRSTRQIEIVHADGTPFVEFAQAGPGVCDRCGAELPIIRIEVVYENAQSHDLI